MTMSQHVQLQDPGTQAAKWNSAISKIAIGKQFEYYNLTIWKMSTSCCQFEYEKRWTLAWWNAVCQTQKHAQNARQGSLIDTAHFSNKAIQSALHKTFKSNYKQLKTIKNN